MGISVENVSKRFGDFQAVKNVSLEVKTGSLVALLGPSGSGKSTLLRIISGLELPDAGRIILTGRDATYQSVQDRKVGFVFQHYALFKHMTVRKNIAFGMEIQKRPQDKIKRRVDTLLDLIQLGGLGDRYPSQLSGGQRQRVALARALAVEPEVLLLDEPFGALDAKVRKDLRDWLRRLHDEVHVTTVFVTHDQEEAMEISDEIVVMNRGEIEQIGSPADIYDKPATPFVMSFVGPVNVVSPTSKLLPQWNTPTSNGDFFLRPHDIEILNFPAEQTMAATVQRVVHLGWTIRVELSLDDNQTVTAYLSREQVEDLELIPKQPVFLRPKVVKTFGEPVQV